MRFKFQDILLALGVCASILYFSFALYFNNVQLLQLSAFIGMFTSVIAFFVIGEMRDLVNIKIKKPKLEKRLKKPTFMSKLMNKKRDEKKPDFHPDARGNKKDRKGIELKL